MALLQLIVYSAATGRVRRVIDPEGEALHPSHLKLAPREASLLYTKVGGGNDHLHAWQVAVARHCGKRPKTVHPVTEAHYAAAGLTPAVVADRYVVIDAGGKIVGVVAADPACGDSIAGHTLVAHDSADERWTYTGGVFTAPVVKTKTPA